MSGVVVADTGPLRYLVLIGYADVLPKLFSTVSIPATVLSELSHNLSPDVVRAWVADAPPWLEIHPNPDSADATLQRLDPGERAVIALAEVLGAGLLLIDDRAAVAAARRRSFRVTGTLGVLVDAASQDLLDLEAA